MDPLALTVAERHQKAALTFPREFYLPPEVRGTDPINPKGTDLYVWLYDDRRGNPAAVAFVGRQRKPIWQYRFRDEAARQRKIDETARSRKEHIRRKKEEMRARREFQHGLTEGDILVASWGYDQTNVDFYQVTDVRGKHVIVREIASKVVREERGTDYVVAVPNRFIGPTMRRKPTKSGNKPVVKIDSSRRARPWDGKPMYQTAFGYGH